MTRILTGIQSSGNPHWGNYFGMMRPMLKFQENKKNEMFFFIADLHAFTTVHDPEVFRANQKNIVLDWLALGLDPERSMFYRQSDVPAHTECFWYLMCMTPMGLLERAHSYKDKVAKGLDANVGLFTYPMLMAADILLYDAEVIPVGKDQKQHVEMARDIAQKFNHHFGETFILPEPGIQKEVETIPGLDGQKMSKSYGNTISIFEDEKTLKKKIMSIQTASLEMGEPMDPDTCTVFRFHELFENPNLKQIRKDYKEGNIGFGDSKKQLLAHVLDYFSEARARRAQFEQTPHVVEELLQKGARKAQEIANAKLDQVKKNIGIVV